MNSHWAHIGGGIWPVVQREGPVCVAGFVFSHASTIEPDNPGRGEDGRNGCFHLWLGQDLLGPAMHLIYVL